MVTSVDSRAAAFDALLRDVEPRLRRALVAAHGPTLGREAAADAMAWAWEHLERLGGVANPAGYLWRVAQSSLRRQRRHARFEVPASTPDASASVNEPASGAWDRELIDALADLTTNQRVSVVLVDAYAYPLAEAAAVLDCSVSTLRNHLARARRSLRARLGDER